MFLGTKIEKDMSWQVRRTAREFGVYDISYTWATRAGGQDYGVTTTIDFRGLDYLTAVDLMSGSGLVVRIQGKLRGIVNNKDLSAEEKTKALTKWVNNGSARAIKVASEFAWKASDSDPFDDAVQAMIKAGLSADDARAVLTAKGVRKATPASSNPILIADVAAKAKVA